MVKVKVKVTRIVKSQARPVVKAPNVLYMHRADPVASALRKLDSTAIRAPQGIDTNEDLLKFGDI